MGLRLKPNKNKQPSSKGEIVFACIWTGFSSIFLFIGLYFTYQSIKQQGWDEVPCEVQRFEVSHNVKQDDPFLPVVEFSYSVDGQKHTGKQLWPDQDRVEDYEEIGELLDSYRQNKITHCYVNPDDPNESALARSRDGVFTGIAFTLFGGCFTAIGVAIFVSSSRSRKREKTEQSISSAAKNEPTGKMVAVPFFLLFAATGVGIFCFVIVPRAIEYNEAKSWQETPATIVWSRVTTHSDDDGTTYGVDVFYAYQFDGREFRSNKTEIMSSSSSGRSAKQERVNKLSPGTEVVCYVNPKKPWQALLERDLGWSVLWALFPLPFAAIGIGGLWFCFKKLGKKKKSPYRKSSSSHHSATKPDQFHSGIQREFSGRGQRFKDWLAVCFFAVFWCGITSVFVTIAVKSWLRDDPEWFLTIFIIPFVLVGLTAVIYSCYRFLGIFSSVPRLRLKPASITLGEPTKIFWQVGGNTTRLSDFAIYLVGEERTRKSDDDDNKIISSIFHELEVIKTSDARKITRGEFTIELPSNTMPTWKSDNHQITWSVHVLAKVSLAPNIKDRFVIHVQPIRIPN